MEKIKLTKGELKRQRDGLAQFQHYLPTLQLKKQQLQLRIREAKDAYERRAAERARLEAALKPWVGLLADLGVEIIPSITPTKVRVSFINIAGANIEVFKGVEFEAIALDYYASPLWLDAGIMRLREIVSILAELGVVRKEIDALEKELRVTTQRVNLFEKIKIPESLEHIRRIRIYLGDQQANAVGIGKVAKKKIVAQEELVLSHG